jgi:hypothetical protein
MAEVYQTLNQGIASDFSGDSQPCTDFRFGIYGGKDFRKIPLNPTRFGAWLPPPDSAAGQASGGALTPDSGLRPASGLGIATLQW